MSSSIAVNQPATIAVNKVKDYLNALANADVDRAIKSINLELKPHRADLQAFKTSKVPVMDGVERKVELVPVIDEVTGLQKVRSKRTDKKDPNSIVQVPEFKEVPVMRTLSEAELEDIKHRIDSFNATKGRLLARKSSAYKAHKVKFQKRALRVLIEFVQKVCSDYLNAALVISKKWSHENKSLKVKISLMHMMTCDFLSVPGIKAFMGQEFFNAQRQAFDEQLNSAKLLGAKEEKKRLKGEGYSKSAAARKRDSEAKKFETLKAIEEDKCKFKDLTCEKYLESKSRELLKKPTKNTEKKERKTTEKANIMFAGAVKTQFKAATEKAYTVSHEVVVFLDKCIKEFFGHVAAFATASFRVSDNKTFTDANAAAFVSSYISSDIKISKSLELKEVLVPSESALEAEREKNANLRSKGILPPKIDEDLLPKEQGYEVDATVTLDGQFGECYNYLESKLYEFRMADKKKSDESKTKAPKESVKQVLARKTSKRQEEDSDSDSSDSEDEAPQVVTKKHKVSRKH